MEVYGLCSTMIHAGEAIHVNVTMTVATVTLPILETRSSTSSTCLADSNVSWSTIATGSTPFVVPNPKR